MVEQSASAPSVLICPVGHIASDLLRWLRADLADAMAVTSAVEAETALPKAGYDAGRGQYRGQAVLEALPEPASPDFQRILGLIGQDCYASGLNFIFGQAAPRTGKCFVALPRLRQSFYGLPEDVDRFRRRLLKEAVHELGHTWGLGHCPDPQCVMHFSNSLDHTDIKAATFCKRCEQRLPDR